MKNLGLRHSTLTLALVPELLAIHPMFETPEPNVEEPSCILKYVYVIMSFIALDFFYINQTNNIIFL